MTIFTKIAWRNVSKNKLRSFFALSTIALGLACLIFLKGFVDGADRQMVENYTNVLTGHIQIHRVGFQKNMELENSITNATVITSELQRFPEILAFGSRIKEHALISSSEGSTGILLLGINPSAEQKLSSLPQYLSQGKFLSKNIDDQIVIGKALATNLKVGVGDKVVLISQASDGSMAAAAYNVCGLLDSGTDEIDKNIALITLKGAQDLLAMGSQISEIVIKTNALDKIEALTAALKNQIDTERFEVLTWKEVSPETYQRVQFDQAFVFLVFFIVLIAIVSGFFHRALMNTIECRREFGMMLTLGAKPSQIFTTVVLESFFLGLLSTLIGTVLGAGCVIFFDFYGMNLPFISSVLNRPSIGSVIHPKLDIVAVAFSAGVVLLMSILVALLPAKKASRLSLAEVFRHM